MGGARVYTRFWFFWAAYEPILLMEGCIIHEVLISPLAASGMTYEVLISQFLPGRLDLRGQCLNFTLKKWRKNREQNLGDPQAISRKASNLRTF